MRTLTKALIVAGAMVALLWGVLHVNAKELDADSTPTDYCSAPVIINGVKKIKVTSDQTGKRIRIENIDQIQGDSGKEMIKCVGHAITNFGEFVIFWMVTTDSKGNLNFNVKLIR